MRAAVFDLTHMGQGRRPIGASTITQQVAKNMLLDNQVSLARKAREAILAMRIEQTLSKERILELYLNEIYLGLGSYGVAAAAQAYFNKPLDKLTLPEAAFLAALPKAPNNYNPFKFPDAAKARRDWVLDRMAEDHVDHRCAGGGGQGRADRAVRVPPPAADSRCRLVHRGGAAPTDRAVRRRRDDAGRADGANQPGSRAAGRRREGGARRADGATTASWAAGAARSAHLDGGPALATNWAEPLGQMARPPGMLPDWRLAVVLEATDGEAKLGWLDRPVRSDAAAAHRRAAAVRRRLGAAGEGRQAWAGAAAHDATWCSRATW